MTDRTRPGRLDIWLGAFGPGAGRGEVPGPDWRFDYLFSISSVSWFIHFAVTILAALVLYFSGAGAWTLVWLGMMVILTTAMLTLSFHYLHRRKSTAPERYGRFHTALTLLVAISWGTGALITARTADTEMLSFYTLVMGGTALGAVSSQHSLMRSCMTSLWVSVPLLAIAWVTHSRDPGAMATAGMMVLFGGVMSLLAVRLGGFVSRNAELATQLAAKNDTLGATAAKLQRAHEEKSRFLAQASHDLRQPIHAIGLFVEYLNGMRMSRDSRAVLGNIDRSLDSLNRLCRSLLDLSALDVGRVKPRIGPVDLGEVMGEVVRQSQKSAQLAGIALRFRPSRLWTRTDAALLQTIVQNLVSNAIKYAPGAQLLIGIRRRNGRLAIVVADTGPGINADDHDRIFDEFVQLGVPNTAGADGLGLGLSIVSRLAYLLDLEVNLVSEPGIGTCFLLDGLLEVPAAPDRRASRTMRHEDRLNGTRVLVIDDDPLVRAGTVQVLSRWGCVATATDSVTESTEIPDIVLCDQFLADGDFGLEVIARLRHRARTPLPAAIITGTPSDALAAACRDADITLLTKPVRPAQLRSVLIAAQTRPSSEAIPAAAERVVTSSARSRAET